MAVSFLAGLLVASWVAFFLVYRALLSRMELLRRARERVEQEETRVFDFLHGLGAAFSSETRPDDLHRLIVEGAQRILESDGGGLYSISPGSSMLVPRFISKNCPPLVEVPANVAKDAETLPQALQSFLRLRTVEPGEGLIGEAWKQRSALVVFAPDPRLEAYCAAKHKTSSLMVAPLEYGERRMGMLVLANGSASSRLIESDFVIFKAIAEQAAFALYNTFIYSQAEEKKRLDHDLQVAEEIQRILMPSESPKLNNFEVDGISKPARQMSGDYYGYIPIDPTRWGIAIADVSGKGVAASLIMAMCRSVLRIEASRGISAAQVLKRVNAQLYPDIKEDMFISMAYLILDDQSSIVTLCRAGHDAPLLYSAKDGSVSKLTPPGMALGIDSGDVFNRISADFSVELESGDYLILYTDGVTEALDSKGMEFGMKRMIQSIQASANEGAQGMRRRLIDDLLEFADDCPQSDDITLIVIRKK
jgi:sigma-B regulation protein RsbU (phosphoserine phosphatase)